MTKSVAVKNILAGIAIFAITLVISFASVHFGWTGSGTECIKVADFIPVTGNCYR